MKFNKELYFGEKASLSQKELIKVLKKKKLLIGLYVITTASNESNLLDIYEATQFLQPSLSKNNFMVVGIALGREEALAVVTQIIDDIYQQTGGFDIKKFFGITDKKR